MSVIQFLWRHITSFLIPVKLDTFGLATESTAPETREGSVE